MPDSVSPKGIGHVEHYLPPKSPLHDDGRVEVYPSYFSRTPSIGPKPVPDVFETAGWFTFKSESVDIYVRQWRLAQIAYEYIHKDSFGDLVTDESEKALELIKGLNYVDIPRIPELLLKMTCMKFLQRIKTVLPGEDAALLTTIQTEMHRAELGLKKAVLIMANEMRNSEAATEGTITREDALWLALSRQYASFFNGFVLNSTKTKLQLSQEILSLVRKSGPDALEASMLEI